MFGDVDDRMDGLPAASATPVSFETLSTHSSGWREADNQPPTGLDLFLFLKNNPPSLRVPALVCARYAVKSAYWYPGSPSFAFLEAPLGAGHAWVGFEW